MKAQPNEHGVTWATSKSGRLRIAVRQFCGTWDVWALYTDTHDLAPASRAFIDEPAARAYANDLWRNQ